MTKATLISTAAMTAPIVLMSLMSVAPVVAADAPLAPVAVPAPVIQPSVEQATTFVPLGVGKTVIIDLPRDVRDVLVADPKYANAVVRTSRRVYVIGVAVGQTNIFFFDAEGRQIMGLDIAVTRDLNGIRAALKKMMPTSDITVEGLADGIMLSGTVATPAEATQAQDLAARLAGDAAKVVNGIAVRGRDQVMLKVTVAEVQRDIIKQLGIDLSGTLGNGTSVLNFNNASSFPAFGQPLADNFVTGQFRGVSATLRAMERAGVLRTLAEPNLTAISGESATFMAGGEFPIPGNFVCTPPSAGVQSVCTIQVQFKKFGVGLNFTPVVMSEGRISLKVMSEVSELSSDNSLTITQVGTTMTIPSIKTRRAETTVEIPSGGSLAMAGMIHEQTKQQLNGMPGLMNLPVLGALFKSRDYVNRQTELVILVTPYVVRAVAQKDLSRPDDGYADASDVETTLIGKFNHIYGVPTAKKPARSPYFGNFGFILD